MGYLSIPVLLINVQFLVQKTGRLYVMNQKTDPEKDKDMVQSLLGKYCMPGPFLLMADFHNKTINVFHLMNNTACLYYISSL